jgi:hypothetical protein
MLRTIPDHSFHGSPTGAFRFLGHGRGGLKATRCLTEMKDRICGTAENAERKHERRGRCTVL